MRSGLFHEDGLNEACPDGFVKVCEGSAAVLFPPSIVRPPAGKTANDGGDDSQAVFYNPAQVVNRDLSICAIELFGRKRVAERVKKGAGAPTGISVLEALSATGLRAIRYYKEINNIKYIIANDMDKDAVDCIARNCAYNNIPTASPSLAVNFDESSIQLVKDTPDAEGKAGCSSHSIIQTGGAIIPNLDDANDLMCRLAVNASDLHEKKRLAYVDAAQAVHPLLQEELMDVVDLDPYGTASPFLEGAMRCIKEGGLLLVTSTDSPVLCGNFPDTCHAKYNSISYKGNHCHEMAVRLLLASMERVANKHKSTLCPFLAVILTFTSAALSVSTPRRRR
ncbi:tRNA (guanine-N2-)-methyltransferase [Angomonas deanei]|uniref:tRNA (guanine(26)-N(2))-dimethyltransferase n=1 Tax=Angomonas deanei TaxID=59799 RepID=A0A7G2CMV9_9TRYP|nr:tRNA (guanine-N2-)-methyltransferase [Angomonas deanei]CAD2219602.1 N2,N2-dimethylguanosine tRNA methyltransferase, putative [Angomonas deanei]|eukprot:EPY19676.1 tRNA (guanine-N2-)-methyltransferase [Angomonas deanei]